MEQKCVRHPEKTGKYYCSKYNKYLCEDCLACQDPKLYCKFRSMCLIWEFVKHGTPEMQEKAYAKKKEEAAALKKTEEVKITFLPGKDTFETETGTTVLDAARENDIYINAEQGCSLQRNYGTFKKRRDRHGSTGNSR